MECMNGKFEKKKLVSEIQMLKGEITSKQYEELSNALDEATELAQDERWRRA